MRIRTVVQGRLELTYRCVGSAGMGISNYAAPASRFTPPEPEGSGWGT
jgi:hypothetical protein